MSDAASVALGVAAALLYAVLPGAWLNMKGILSEFPFMALAFGALSIVRFRTVGDITCTCPVASACSRPIASPTSSATSTSTKCASGCAA